jgi:hypothetical protein
MRMSVDSREKGVEGDETLEEQKERMKRKV